MNREIFFELVELKAKTASVLPFLLGICFSWYQYGRLHVGYVLIFFIAMFIFNMAVDILDNYNDYHMPQKFMIIRKKRILSVEKIYLCH